jgi:hypothetical protein
VGKGADRVWGFAEPMGMVVVDEGVVEVME